MANLDRAQEKVFGGSKISLWSKSYHEPCRGETIEESHRAFRVPKFLLTPYTNRLLRYCSPHVRPLNVNDVDRGCDQQPGKTITFLPFVAFVGFPSATTTDPIQSGFQSCPVLFCKCKCKCNNRTMTHKWATSNSAIWAKSLGIKLSTTTFWSVCMGTLFSEGGGGGLAVVPSLLFFGWSGC